MEAEIFTVNMIGHKNVKGHSLLINFWKF